MNLTSLLKFAGGSVFGASLGAAVGALLAPKSGPQMQAETAAFVEEVRSEGERAKTMAEEQAAARYRARVNDPKAMTQPAS